MLEDPRRRMKINFTVTQAKYDKLVKKHSFVGRKIISERCLLIKNKQSRVAFTKPLFIG